MGLTPRASASAAFASSLARGAPVGATLVLAQGHAAGSPLQPRFSGRAIFSPVRLQTSPRAYLGLGVISAGELASADSVMRRNALNRIAAFAPVRDFSSDAAPHRFITAGASAAVQNRISPRGALSPQQQPRRKDDGSEEPRVSLDLLSILGTSPRQALRGLLGQPGNPNATGLGYLTFSGSH